MANKQKSILGLDIGSQKTKVIQLAFTGKSQPELVLCDLLDTGRSDESFQANMKAYISDNQLKNAMAAVSLDDDSMVIRKFEFPKMPEADLMEAIKWSLRDSVEEDVDKYTIKYSKLGEIEEGDLTKEEIVVYAVNKDHVLDYKLKIEQCGVHVFMMEPEAVTLASALDRCHPDEESYLVGLDIGYQHTKFYVIGKRNFIFSRPVGGICYEQYEKSPEEFPQKLAIEVQKSIDTFQVNFQMQDIRSIYLSGGGALIENLSEYLQTNMGLPVEVLDPFKTTKINIDIGPLKSALFAQAVSLAYLQP